MAPPPFPALVIEFVPGTRLYREDPITPGLPIVGNGPPGTFVVFLDGRRVPLPTDQIVEAEDHQGAARVCFGGLRFDGVQRRQLVFRRAREVLPAGQLSPERSRRMTLEPDMVVAILVDGVPVWPSRDRMN